MRLHILGSGCPAPVAERYGSAFILEVGADSVMIDCGPAATYKMARMGIAPGQIGHVFFTHHHFDHNADFPCFALTRWDQSKGAEPPLKVYGPSPTRRFVDRLLGEDGAFTPDWQSRVAHPASHECHRQRGGRMPRPAPRVEAQDVAPGKIVETAAWTVTAARMHHVEPTLESLAYRFDTGEGSVVFAGDCGDSQELRTLAKGAQTLVLACTHFGSPEASPHITDVITGTPEVAAIANGAGAGRVILTHASPNFSKPGVVERAVSEIARAYIGRILFPDELTTVDLST